MLAPLFEQQRVQPMDVVRVTKLTATAIKGRKFVMIAEIENHSIVKHKQQIGDPTVLNVTGGAEEEVKSTASAALNNVPAQSTFSSATAQSAPSPFTTAPSGFTSAPSGFTSAPVQNTFSAPAQSAAPSNGFTAYNQSYAPPAAPAPAVSASNSAPSQINPIQSLTPYNNKFVIRARVANKTPIKKWSNDKGEGTLFSATLVDESGEIRLTAFKNEVDRFYPMLEQGRVYYLSNAIIKPAKRNFNDVRNDYELHLDANTSIQPCYEQTGIPSLRFDFVPIAQLNHCEKDRMVDILGVIREVGEAVSLVGKTTGKPLIKRDVTIQDQSKCAVKLTLWGDQADGFTGAVGQILACKGCRVSDYGGRSLGTSNSSTLLLQPDLPEAHALRGWSDNQGTSSEMVNLSTQGGNNAVPRDDWKQLSQIKDEHLGHGPKPDWFTCLATLVYLKSDGVISYQACPTEGCAKKVVEEGGPGQYRCERCNQVFPRCDYRYILTGQLEDPSGQQWVSLYNEQGEQILGKSAEEMHHLKNEVKHFLKF